MSRRNSAPTHGWIISSQINKYLAALFVLSLLVWFIAIWTVRYSLDKDCSDLYDRRINVFGYWIVIQAGSTKDRCPGVPQT